MRCDPLTPLPLSVPLASVLELRLPLPPSDVAGCRADRRCLCSGDTQTAPCTDVKVSRCGAMMESTSCVHALRCSCALLRQGEGCINTLTHFARHTHTLTPSLTHSFTHSLTRAQRRFWCTAIEGLVWSAPETLFKFLYNDFDEVCSKSTFWDSMKVGKALLVSLSLVTLCLFVQLFTCAPCGCALQVQRTLDRRTDLVYIVLDRSVAVGVGFTLTPSSRSFPSRRTHTHTLTYTHSHTHTHIHTLTYTHTRTHLCCCLCCDRSRSEI